jgi:hypothetical protein
MKVLKHRKVSMLNPLKKDELLGQLDRHLDWIKSCDTKASIVLAAIGIFLTVFTSDNSIKVINKTIKFIIANLNYSTVIYLLLCLLSAISFIFGVYSLIRVLVPQMNEEVSSYKETKKDSLYYFETVAANSFIEYKNKMETRSQEDELTDILSQIYINAQVCTVKYSFYRKGITSSFTGGAGLLIWYIIGLILIKVGGIN